MILKQALRIIAQLLVGSELRHWLDDPKEDHFAPRFARPGIDMTIDAFPRSANTWIYYQAQLAYPHAKIAHHIHSWQHFFFSKLFGVPSVLIVREPDGAVQSLAVKKGGSLALGYLDYIITNGLGSLFADRVHFFDELTGDGGMTGLFSDMTERLGGEPTTVDPDEVRKLMAKRTDHKNVKTPAFRHDELGRFACIMRSAANKVYARIEREWRV
ncbi:MAG: hypothetical protein AAGD43_30200 [Pseudomonadota bacterium]